MRHLPNIICLARIALIWPIIACLLGHRYEQTLLLFFVAAASDGLDGWLAKRFDWTSQLGTLLDPLADKLLLVSVFLVLTWLHEVPRFLAVAVVARDVMIGAGALVYRTVWGPLHGRAILSSKINTLLQIVYVILVVMHGQWGQPSPRVLLVIAAATFATVIYSGAAYLREFTQRALRSAARV